MNLTLDWLRDAAALAVTASIAALPLTLAVLAIDATIGRRLAARYRCLLWMLVAVRMLLPVAPESSWSLQNGWRLANFDSAPRHAAAPDPVPPAARGLASAAPDISAAKPQAAMQPYLAPVAIPAPTASSSFVWYALLFNGLAALWLAGAGWIAIRAIAASVRFARRLRAIPVADDAALRELIEQSCAQLGVRRRPDVKYVPESSAPALFGVLRPTLCLPAASRDELDRDQLHMIVLHELAHVRRRDAWLSWLMTAVQAIQWYNPLAWLVAGRLAAYRELACDDAVRQFTAPDQRNVYAELLLRFAAARPTMRLGLVGMGFARPARSLKSRIEALSRDIKKPRRLSRLVFWALLAVLAAGGLTDAATKNAPKGDGAISIEEWMSRQPARSKRSNETRVLEFVKAPDVDAPLGVAIEEPIEERSYNVAAAVEQLAKADPEADARQWMMTYLQTPGFNAASIRAEEDNPDQFVVGLTPRGHDALADIIDGLGRSGPWQVVVAARIFTGRDDDLQGIDWQEAVNFTPLGAERLPEWPRAKHGAEPGSAVSASIESISWRYAPFVAAVIDTETMRRLVNHVQNDRRQSIRWAPKVTLFNGQRASVRDETYRPFVVGVHYIKGDLGSAAQPDIVTLAEGMRLDVRPLVVDAEALDLNCRMTLSGIDGVDEVKLPGQDVTVQAPRATRYSIDARCRLKQGETLLIAPAIRETGNEAEAAADRRTLYFAITAEWFPDTFYSRLNVEESPDGQ